MSGNEDWVQWSTKSTSNDSPQVTVLCFRLVTGRSVTCVRTTCIRCVNIHSHLENADQVTAHILLLLPLCAMRLSAQHSLLFDVCKCNRAGVCQSKKENTKMSLVERLDHSVLVCGVDVAGSVALAKTEDRLDD